MTKKQLKQKYNKQKKEVTKFIGKYFDASLKSHAFDYKKEPDTFKLSNNILVAALQDIADLYMFDDKEVRNIRALTYNFT